MENIPMRQEDETSEEKSAPDIPYVGDVARDEYLGDVPFGD